MGMANVNIEDSGDGEINANFVYVGGFDPNSPAHQHVLIIDKILQILLSQQGPVSLTPTSPQEAEFHRIAALTREKILQEGLGDPLAGRPVEMADPRLVEVAEHVIVAPEKDFETNMDVFKHPQNSGEA